MSVKVPSLAAMIEALASTRGVHFKLFNKLADNAAETVTMFAIVGASHAAVHKFEGVYGSDYFVVENEDAATALYLAITAWNDLQQFGPNYTVHVLR